MFKSTLDSDEKFIAAVQNKNAAGWGLLVTRYDPLIKSVARWPKWNFSKDEQQDVCQNIHIHLQSALPKFRKQSSLSWFIKQISIRECINEIRRQKRWRTVMTPAVQQTKDGSWREMEFASLDETDPHAEAVQNEQRESLRLALRHLHRTCRESIDMFYLQHLSYREMSEKLGISVNTVGSRLAKCLEKLHKELKKQPQFERID